MGLNFEDLYHNQIFSYKPYDKPSILFNIDSVEFFEAIKSGNIYQIKFFLANDPNLVYAFDQRGMTGLHHACLFNNL